MEHAITVGDVLLPLGILAGVVGLAAVLLGLVWLLNPFRTGH